MGRVFCPSCAHEIDTLARPENCPGCGSPMRYQKHRRRSKRSSSVKARKVAALIKRDGLRCWICGGMLQEDTPEGDPWAITLDHYVPVSRGGADANSNLRLAHACCNSDRGNPDV